MKLLTAALFWLAAAGLASAADAPKLEPGDKRGLVVVEVVRPALVRPGSKVTVGIVPYDAAEGRIIHNFWNIIRYTPTADFQAEGPTYVYERVRPGVHAINTLYLGLHWGVCYNTGTVEFDVRPGEVVFLGRLDPTADAQAILTKLPGSVSVSAYTQAQPGGPLVFDTQRLKLEPASPASTAAFAEHVRTGWPKVSGPVRAAELRPATFTTGRDATGLATTCGGLGGKPTRGPAAAAR